MRQPIEKADVGHKRDLFDHQKMPERHWVLPIAVRVTSRWCRPPRSDDYSPAFLFVQEQGELIGPDKDQMVLISNPQLRGFSSGSHGQDG